MDTFKSIEEWCSTPAGSLDDKPSWGHMFQSFNFVEESVDDEVMAELAISEKIEQDIAGLGIKFIKVGFPEKGCLQIAIKTPDGDFTKSIPGYQAQ